MSVDQSVLQKVVDSVTVSADYTSDIFPAEWVDTLSFELAWSGGTGITGTFTIEVSVSGINWIALTTAQFQPAVAMTVSGASGFHIRDITGGTGLRKFRVKFSIANAGSMVMDAWIGAKRG